MIKKLRKIALGTVAFTAVIILFATGPVSTHQAQVWFQAANAQALQIDQAWGSAQEID